jgi:hypothetical protein
MVTDMDKRKSDAEYAEMAADYEVNPPTADEIVSVEVNPALLRTGRPRKGAASAGKSAVTPVRLPERIRVELAMRAEIEDAPVSELIRRAIVEYFDAHPVS